LILLKKDESIELVMLRIANAEEPEKSIRDIKNEALAPIATSGNNVYITWWSSKMEMMKYYLWLVQIME
jgi:hypothetical protein